MIIDSKMGKGGIGMVVNVDMMKAYDHISWNFFDWFCKRSVLVRNGGSGSEFVLQVLGYLSL